MTLSLYSFAPLLQGGFIWYCYTRNIESYTAISNISRKSGFHVTLIYPIYPTLRGFIWHIRQKSDRCFHRFIRILMKLSAYLPFFTFGRNITFGKFAVFYNPSYLSLSGLDLCNIVLQTPEVDTCPPLFIQSGTRVPIWA